jgi:hypothetical protein
MVYSVNPRNVRTSVRGITDSSGSRFPPAGVGTGNLPSYSTFSIGSPARFQATKPPATSAAPARKVAFERTACWHK